MKVSGAFFYENIWRNKIVPGPKYRLMGQETILQHTPK